MLRQAFTSPATSGEARGFAGARRLDVD